MPVAHVMHLFLTHTCSETIDMPDAAPLANPHLNQIDVLALVRAERVYQDRKWGSLADHPHEVGAWLLVMQGKLDAAIATWQTTPNDLPALANLIKAVAVGVACLEQHAGPLVLKLLADMEFTQTHCGYATPSRRDECIWPALEAIRSRIKSAAATVPEPEELNAAIRELERM